MKRKNIQLVLVLFAILTVLSVTSLVNVNSMCEIWKINNTTKTPKNWTYMMYLCGDTFDDDTTSTTDNTGNWLAATMIGIINNLNWYYLESNSDFNLNVIALMDYAYDSATSSGESKILKIESGNVIDLDVTTSKNMGSYFTLYNFIDYCKTNYPANNYALVINDHGAGYAGMSYDFHGTHPYWNYSYGDCLTLEEVGDAIGDAGGVDVLFLDVCKGGSFELMWQLADKAHYAVAGESALIRVTTQHSQDILYDLSRDTGMTPLELAQVGFDYAVNPDRVISLPYEPTLQWRTEVLADLSRINYVPAVGIGFKDAFSNFAQSLYDELVYNITRGQLLFGEIRNNLTYHSKIFQSNSMMVDLTDFVQAILANTSIYHFEDQVSSAANTLLNQLAEGPGNLIVAEDHIASYTNVHGFSICFPNSADYYQGYLYPNFYENLDISVDTYWDEFVFLVNPSNEPDLFLGPIPEFYEIYLGPIDPSIGLHVFLKNEDLTQPPPHVGYGNVEIPGSHMGLEIGIEGAEYLEDFLFGSTSIKIPMSSLESYVKNGNNPYLTVKVDASTSPSAVKPVNLTVSHVKDGEVIWEDNRVQDIDIGEAFESDIFLDDTWTDFEVINYNDTKTGLFGPEKPIVYTSTFTFVLMIIIIVRRRKR